MKQKQMAATLYFGSPRLEHTIKTNCVKRQAVDPNI